MKKQNVFYVTSDHTFLKEYLKHDLNIIYIQLWTKKEKSIIFPKKKIILEMKL